MRAKPRWPPGLILHGYRIHGGSDADQPGETAAEARLARHPQVLRLRPSTHDWNDALASQA